MQQEQRSRSGPKPAPPGPPCWRGFPQGPSRPRASRAASPPSTTAARQPRRAKPSGHAASARSLPVVFFLAKAKSLLFVIFKFKFLLSFFAFFGLYWAVFGWKFGLGFTLSIMIHEFGHYVAARRRGLKVDLPVFLPGLGAYVRWYNMGVNLDTLSSHRARRAVLRPA
jgi:hypothetical protein